MHRIGSMSDHPLDLVSVQIQERAIAPPRDTLRGVPRPPERCRRTRSGRHVVLEEIRAIGASRIIVFRDRVVASVRA